MVFTEESNEKALPGGGGSRRGLWVSGVAIAVAIRLIITKVSVDRINAGMSQNDVIAALGRCADVAAPSSKGSDCFWINNDKSKAVIKFDFDFHVISAEWQPAPGAGSNEKLR